jgi:hypothetical protein
VGEELDLVDGLAEVVDAILVSVAAHPLDDATFEEGDLVPLEELDGLDSKGTIVVAVHLEGEWGGRGIYRLRPEGFLKADLQPFV